VRLRPGKGIKTRAMRKISLKINSSIKVDYVLDPSGTTEKKIAVCVYGKATGD